MKHYIATLIILFISSLLTVYFLSAKDEFNIYFCDEPCIRPNYSYNYLTCSNINVIIINNGITVPVKIPEGFYTDLLSVPRWLWPFISPARSEFMAPAILHDYLYGCHMGFTRSQIDTILLKSLTESGVSFITAYQMYFAVRIFGGSHFESGQCVIEDD